MGGAGSLVDEISKVVFAHAGVGDESGSFHLEQIDMPDGSFYLFDRAENLGDVLRAVMLILSETQFELTKQYLASSEGLDPPVTRRNL